MSAQLHLESRDLTLALDPDQGADVVSLVHRATGVDVCWRWPGTPDESIGDVGEVDPDERAFYERYRGGWQTVMPNGGPASSHDGMEFPRHGDVAALPWQIERYDSSNARLSVTSSVSGLRMVREVTVVGDRAEFFDMLENPTDSERRAMWGLHLAFGAPFAGPGARIELPPGARFTRHVGELGAPRRLGPEEVTWPYGTSPEGVPVDLSVLPEPGAPTEMLYGSAGAGTYAVVSAGPARLRARVRWDASVLPELWLWQEFGAHVTHPWYGDAYVLGLEPFAGSPSSGLGESVARGTALVLPPGRQLSLAWSVQLDQA